MTGELWIVLGGLAVISNVTRAAGPVALGGRDLPPRLIGVITLMAAPLLAALVVTQALADGERLYIGADTAGVAAAGLVFWRRGSILIGVAVAMGVTAGLRLLL